jgi:DnaJ-class molecular chaperone
MRDFRAMPLLIHPGNNKSISHGRPHVATEKRRIYDRFGNSQFRQRYRPEDIFEGFNFKDLFREFDLRFDEDISRRFFSGRRGRGCGRRKARFFRNNFFQNYPHGLWGDDSPLCDIFLDPIEAYRGTEKEIVLKRGWHTERVTIKIPPGVEDDTVLSISLKGRDESCVEDFYEAPIILF